ncbi:MAG: sigma-54-dependent Fis family transcriptional regulator [Deltaproteobacteria bacterium]|nr:sigma-54-dependent Fis family transcriptional regulator [Deltaproteobacteria bacterium]
MSYPILIVDNEPDMRSVLTRALSSDGYSVESATNGLQALEKFGRGEYSLVIADMKLPEMSGIKVLTEVKKLSPDVPVIMTTANGTIKNAVEAMQCGASDFILKPFSQETLELVVKKVGQKSNGRSKARSGTGDLRKGEQPKKMVTQDPKLLKILNLAKNIAPSKATVLIQGESGTGKEVLASFIHAHNGGDERPYIAINCASLPDALAESELFGHEKGSFTGAITRKVGKFELANHGTVVLDEISEMPMPIQAKLLRALQERTIDRVGGSKPVPIDVRIIAISNVDIKSAVREGKFREDLFYRINVIPFTIPPLRERKRDIPLLAQHFLKKYSSLNGIPVERISDEALSLLSGLEWKGNVRELENTIERAVLLAGQDTILPDHLFLEEEHHDQERSNRIRPGLTVKEMERKLIFKTLEEVSDNRTHAAEMLGISIRTLRNKLREYKEEGRVKSTA